MASRRSGRFSAERPDLVAVRGDAEVAAFRSAVGEVLVVGQGLDYDRRALNLLQAAKRIVHEHQGRCPGTMHELMALPGMGRSTAGAVAVFAFGVAHPFVETNTHAALVHRFVPPGVRVSEGWLLKAAERALDRTFPREWHYALMGYGADLKRITPGLTSRAGGRVAPGPLRRVAPPAACAAAQVDPGGAGSSSGGPAPPTTVDRRRALER